jgi:uncharacterized membrane protein
MEWWLVVLLVIIVAVALVVVVHYATAPARYEPAGKHVLITGAPKR